MAKTSLDEARRAKTKTGHAVRQIGRVAGIGVTKIGGSYAVKVNLASPPEPNVALPNSVDGVRVIYEVVGRISKRAN
jgi:hypothetical protein